MYPRALIFGLCCVLAACGGSGDGGTGGAALDDLSFSVDSSTFGVDGTSVAGEASSGEAAADLFTSPQTGNHAPAAAGTNSQVLDQAALGLSGAEDLDAVSFGPFVPAPWHMFFSLRDTDGPVDTQGIDGSGVRFEQAETIPGDVYQSEYREFRLSGNNILRADEITMGLLPHDLNVFGTDELDALELSEPPSDAGIFFSLVPDGPGFRGADIFMSIAGGVSQVLSADAIGLLRTDDVDGLVVQDVDGNGLFSSGDYIMFSVGPESQGKEGTDVREQARVGEVAGDVFVSFGDGTHELLIDERDLGLLRTDDVDALEILGLGDSGECGDGVLQNPPEQCEIGVPCPGGLICDTNKCLCGESLFCGDGILTFPEACEIGFPCPAGQFCNRCTCLPFVLCGNKVLDPGEQCDNPPFICPNPQLTCNNCMCEGCGNSVLEGLEQCERGMLACPRGTTCDVASCRCRRGEYTCPNGVLDPGEECEPFVPCVDPGQVCNWGTCLCEDLPTGCILNGVVVAPEECDPLADPSGCDNGERCTVECTCVPECNVNGTVDGLEACDPLAIPTGCAGGEACTEDCRCLLYTPRCGDGAWSPPVEECEYQVIHGNPTQVGTCDSGQTCSDCRCEQVTPRCGDGFYTPAGPEECDWVDVGGNQVSFGCDLNTAEVCDRESCKCLSCFFVPREFEGLLNGRDFIPLCQFFEGPAPPDECREAHYHSSQAVAIDIETGVTTVLPDPAPQVCGYGTVDQVTKRTLDPTLSCPLGDALMATIGGNCLLQD